MHGKTRLGETATLLYHSLLGREGCQMSRIVGLVLAGLLLALPVYASAAEDKSTPVETTKDEAAPKEKDGVEAPNNVLPLPRFASLRSNKVFSRAGPGKRYPIEWEYHLKGAPVEIVAEFDYWRRIKDWQGSLSWVHKSMLIGRRGVYVTHDTLLRRGETSESGGIAKVKKGAFGQLVACQAHACEIDFSIRQGWLPRSVIWGVYDKELIK